MSLPGNARLSMIGCGSLALPNNSGSRSPLIAALLSLLAPGLGQVYVGRPARGAIWFVAILALQATTLHLMLNQPRFALVMPTVAVLILALLFQIGKAAVLARRATQYQLRRSTSGTSTPRCLPSARR